MKRHALFLALLAGSALAAGENKVVSVFGPGEQTDYEVRYMGITAGRAQLTVGWPTEEFGHDVWPLVCIGESTLGNIYPIKDRFISYWEPVSRQALGADFFMNENKYRRKDRYVYDFEHSEAVVTSNKDGDIWEKKYGIEQGTLDLAAAGFGLRNTPLEVGQVHELPIFTGKKFYKMTATVAGREKLKTDLGEMDVFRVTVNGDFSGSLKTKGLMTLFYTADDKQLPVRAEAEFFLGTVRLDAVKYAQGRVYKEN